MAVKRGTVTGVTGNLAEVRVDGVGSVGAILVLRHRAPTDTDPDALTAMPRVGDRVVVASTTDSVDDRIVIGVLP